MTTHEQHTYTEPTEGSENPRQGTDPVPERASDPGNTPTGYAESAPQSDSSDRRGLSEDKNEATSTQTQATVPQPAAAVVSAEPSSEQSVRDPAESTAERSLFANDELAGLRARWDNVQAAFVDDPRDCVHKADGLVSDVVDQLTSGFSEARARLEDQWARGEEASTEDLRVALKQYREFFQRLLAV